MNRPIIHVETAPNGIDLIDCECGHGIESHGLIACRQPKCDCEWGANLIAVAYGDYRAGCDA